MVVLRRGLAVCHRLLIAAPVREEGRSKADFSPPFVTHSSQSSPKQLERDRDATAQRNHRSIHSTNDPTLSVTNITRRTVSFWYISFAPARASSTDE